MQCKIEQLYDYFLKQFVIYVDDVEYKTGQLRLISHKEDFIVFSYNDENARIKSLEIPIPYKLSKQDNTFELDYTIETLCNSHPGEYNNELKLAVLAVNLDNKHPFFNKIVKLIFA